MGFFAAYLVFMCVCSIIRVVLVAELIHDFSGFLNFKSCRVLLLFPDKLILCYDHCRLEENENLVLTPFEKNLDIWRQLWRVLERSDLVRLLCL